MRSKQLKRGWRNNYRADMPFTERIIKDVSEFFSDCTKWAKNGFSLPVIVVWPDFPSKRTTIYKIAKRMGYRITNQTVKKPALVLYFDDSTYGESEFLTTNYTSVRIWNKACVDISKKKVDEVHLKVFGYNTFIDPMAYSGEAVAKSDMNALHDGEIISCPAQHRDAGKVYQVLIDNSFDQYFVIDYRVPVIRGRIPHVYRKFKRYDVRFTNDVTRSDLQQTSAFFSEQEQELLIRFAESMGADFCELDVLRNNSDQKIYVIDLNKTPYGPPFGLSQDDVERAIKNLTLVFTDALKDTP